jgi:hypothetical protein
MDDVLLGIVLRRLEEFPLAEHATDLLLAALDGGESLSAQLGAHVQPRPNATDVTTAPSLAGAYLQSLTVSGFRGIGPSATWTRRRAAAPRYASRRRPASRILQSPPPALIGASGQHGE